ncbi:MAG: murein L,D-transpeptidase [Acidobacteria bacterium]|nr:murein L,D-transpeptidase [Acidobacteriota bacterium]
MSTLWQNFNCLHALVRWVSWAIAIALLSTIGAVQAQTRTTKPPAKQVSKPAPSAEEFAEARQRLAELGYWLQEDEPKEDASFRHALIAFQKIEGRPRTGKLTKEELEALRTATPPQPRETGYPHVEVDLCRQVLFLVEAGDKPLRVLPVSTGSGKCFTEGGRTRQAITPTGRFKIQWKLKGWRKSPLGLLYYPNYFYDGVAIHGNPSVPAEPASHGCVRIPMFAAEEFSDLAPVGMVALVYNSNEPL